MMSTWCSKHVEAWNKTYCKTKILCIMLVNYWDKYTEMHGQQNVKIILLIWRCQILVLLRSVLRISVSSGGWSSLKGETSIIIISTYRITWLKLLKIKLPHHNYISGEIYLFIQFSVIQWRILAAIFRWFSELRDVMQGKEILCPADMSLTLILLTWRIWWASNNASRWQMRLNSAFNGLNVRS